jgi:hypothetical protein
MIFQRFKAVLALQLKKFFKTKSRFFTVGSSQVSQKVGLSLLIFLYFYFSVFHFMLDPYPYYRTGMRSGSRSAKTKSCGSSVSDSTTLIIAPDST